MLKKMVLLIIILILVPSVFTSQNVSAADGDSNSDQLQIDLHWIDIKQLDNSNDLEVEEYFFVNNTGDEPFVGDINIWLNSGSRIVAKCCGNAPGMVCKFTGDGYMSCFSMYNSGGNIFTGRPNPDRDIVAYYGQKGQLTISTNSMENSTLRSELTIDLELGGINAKRNSEKFSEDKIQLNSKHSKIGFVPIISMEMPSNISKVETIEVSNNNNKPSILNFSITGLPEGWFAALTGESNDFDPLTLAPNESRSLSLEVIAPSYIMPIEVAYVTTMTHEGEENIKAEFNKKYIYDTAALEYYVYLKSDNDLEPSQDLQMVYPSGEDGPLWKEDKNRYWYIFQSSFIEADAESTLSFEWKESEDSPIQAIYIVIILMIIAMLTIPILKKKGVIGKKKIDGDPAIHKHRSDLDDDDLDVDRDFNRQILVLKKERKKYLAVIERVRSDLEDGYIDKNHADDIIERYNRKLGKNTENLNELLISGVAKPKSEGPNRKAKESLKSKNIRKPVRSRSVEVRSTSRKVEKPSSHPDIERPVSSKDVDEIEILIKKLDNDKKSGLLPEEIYKELKEKYDKELIELKKQAEMQNHSLILKRDQMKRAINSLKSDFENEHINEIVYNKLVNDYTRQIENLNAEINEGGY